MQTHKWAKNWVIRVWDVFTMFTEGHNQLVSLSSWDMFKPSKHTIGVNQSSKWNQPRGCLKSPAGTQLSLLIGVQLLTLALVYHMVFKHVVTPRSEHSTLTSDYVQLNNLWSQIGRSCQHKVLVGRNSSVGRALDWRSKGPWFNPGFRHQPKHSAVGTHFYLFPSEDSFYSIKFVFNDIKRCTLNKPPYWPPIWRLL